MTLDHVAIRGRYDRLSQPRFAVMKPQWHCITRLSAAAMTTSPNRTLWASRVAVEGLANRCNAIAPY
jgi:hypothetical protein